MYFKAFYILSADVYNKFNVGHKAFSGGKVSNGFNYAVIYHKGIFYYFLTVSRNGRGSDIYIGFFGIEFFKEGFYYGYGVSAVRKIA